MPVVVADTGPLHYLVLIGEIELLPRLFARVLVPELVHQELRHERTPAPVRVWASAPPSWLRIAPTPPLETLPFPALDDGERAALALAQTEEADLVLMDDRAGVATARTLAIEATGTLGVLGRAAARELVDLPAAVARLRASNFWCAPALLESLLARYGK